MNDESSLKKNAVQALALTKKISAPPTRQSLVKASAFGLKPRMATRLRLGTVASAKTAHYSILLHKKSVAALPGWQRLMDFKVAALAEFRS